MPITPYTPPTRSIGNLGLTSDLNAAYQQLKQLTDAYTALSNDIANLGGGGSTGVPGEFDITKFGYSANGSRASNASAYYAAVAEASPVRGILRWPAGTIFMDPVDWDPRVQMKGVGWESTVFDVPSGQYQFIYDGPGLTESTGEVSHMGFIGNNVGGGGFKTTAQLAYFNFHDIKFLGSKNWTFDLYGCLIGEFTRLWTRSTDYGIKNFGILPDQGLANLVTIQGCYHQAVKYRSIHWENGSSLYVTNTDFESCGITGNMDTGLVKLVNSSPMSEPIAMTFEKRYTENNAGVGIDIVGGAGNTKVVLREAANWNYTNQPLRASAHVRATSGAGKVTIYVENSDMAGSSVADFITSGNVAVELWRSTIGSHTESGGSTWTDLSAGSGTTTPGGTGSTNTRYADSVVAESTLVYFNRLNGSTSSQAPVTGTGAMALTGAFQTGQASVLTSDVSAKSVAFQGGTGTVNLDLSGTANVALEFWLYFDASTTGGAGGVLEHGSPNWGARGGDFTFAPWADSGRIYVGIRHPNTAEVTEYFFPAPPAGNSWKHILLMFNNSAPTLYINKVQVTPNTVNGNTPNFPLANDVMKLFGGTNQGRVAEFAVYKDYNPTLMVSRSAAHYDARNN